MIIYLHEDNTYIIQSIDLTTYNLFSIHNLCYIIKIWMPITFYFIFISKFYLFYSKLRTETMFYNFLHDTKVNNQQVVKYLLVGWL